MTAGGAMSMKSRDPRVPQSECFSGTRHARSQRGVALIAALLLMMLLSALALSLTMVTSTEERIADFYLPS